MNRHLRDRQNSQENAKDHIKTEKDRRGEGELLKKIIIKYQT